MKLTFQRLSRLLFVSFLIASTKDFVNNPENILQVKDDLNQIVSSLNSSLINGSLNFVSCI
jgi:hypothetical protein